MAFFLLRTFQMSIKHILTRDPCLNIPPKVPRVIFIWCSTSHRSVHAVREMIVHPRLNFELHCDLLITSHVVWLLDCDWVITNHVVWLLYCDWMLLPPTLSVCCNWYLTILPLSTIQTWFRCNARARCHNLFVELRGCYVSKGDRVLLFISGS